MVELREPGPIEKIQVITRPEDAEIIEVSLSDTDWDSFETPTPLSKTMSIQNSKAHITYTFESVAATWLKVAFTRRNDPNSRIFEIRAYRDTDTHIPAGKPELPKLDSHLIEGVGISPVQNMVVDTMWSERGHEIFGGGLWRALDLGTPTRIERLQVIPSQDGPDDYVQYIVYGSPDGEAWSIIADMSENLSPTPATGHTFAFPPADIRYIALKMGYNSSGIYDNWYVREWNIDEVRVEHSVLR
jgi:hypothetical protein